MSAAKTKRAGFAGDHPLIGVIVASFLLLGVASSFGLSALGLWHLAGTMGVEGGWRLLLVFVIDGIIIGATGSILLLRGRGESKAMWFLWGVVFLFTGISAWANYTSHRMQGQDVSSSAMGAFMPLALLVATEVVLIALVRGSGEAPERKPRRMQRAAPTIPTIATAEAPVTPATARPARPTAPRAPRSSAGSIPNSYPFEEVNGMSEDALLAEFDNLAAHPETGVRGSAESPRFSAVAWRLVEAHGHRLSDLARRAGHADAAKLKDRVRKVREKAPLTV